MENIKVKEHSAKCTEHTHSYHDNYTSTELTKQR